MGGCQRECPRFTPGADAARSPEAGRAQPADHPRRSPGGRCAHEPEPTAPDRSRACRDSPPVAARERPYATAALARMDDVLPWFRTMPAETRAWIGLVAQAGIASFVEWYRHPDA